MTGQFRILRAFGLAAALLSVAGAERAAAVAYKATIISSTGYDYPTVGGISGASVVGSGSPSSGPNQGGSEAILWNGTTNPGVSLNPGADWQSQGMRRFRR